MVKRKLTPAEQVERLKKSLLKEIEELKVATNKKLAAVKSEPANEVNVAPLEDDISRLYSLINALSQQIEEVIKQSQNEMSNTLNQSMVGVVNHIEQVTEQKANKLKDDIKFELKNDLLSVDNKINNVSQRINTNSLPDAMLIMREELRHIKDKVGDKTSPFDVIDRLDELEEKLKQLKPGSRAQFVGTGIVSGGIGEAPLDGKPYNRQDEAWVEDLGLIPGDDISLLYNDAEYITLADLPPESPTNRIENTDTLTFVETNDVNEIRSNWHNYTPGSSPGTMLFNDEGIKVQTSGWDGESTDYNENGGAFEVYTGGSVNGEGGFISLLTGESEVYSGWIEMSTGDALNGDTGDMYTYTGRTNNGYSGSLYYGSGWAAGPDPESGDSGSVYLDTGNSNQQSGGIYFNTGYSNYNESGAIGIHTGSSNGPNSGDVTVSTGNAVNDEVSGKSGDVVLHTGIAHNDDVLSTSGDVVLYTGRSQSTTGNISVKTGTAGSSSGAVNLESGVSTGERSSGDVNILSGENHGTGTTGDVFVETGHSVKNQTGELILKTGYTRSGTQSGNVTLASGYADANSTGESGNVSIFTGNSDVSSGEIEIYTGDAYRGLASGVYIGTGESHTNSGTAGNIDITTGWAYSGANSGSIDIHAGVSTQATSGGVKLRSDVSYGGSTGDVEIGTGDGYAGSAGDIILKTGNGDGTTDPSSNIILSTGRNSAGDNGIVELISANEDNTPVILKFSLELGHTSFQVHPNTVTQIDYILPEEQGDANTILYNDGTGGLTWVERLQEATIPQMDAATERGAYVSPYSLNRMTNVSLGTGAFTSKGTNAIGIGVQAGKNSQDGYAIAIGRDAAYLNQSTKAVAVGYQAGYSAQGTFSLAIGNEAGKTSQGSNALAVGSKAGYISQGLNTVALGVNAGYDSQSNYGIAIGSGAGGNRQGAEAIAIGQTTASVDQGISAIAIGGGAANTNQSTYGIAIGDDTARFNQGESAIAIGRRAGYNDMGDYAIAIGDNCSYSGIVAGGIRIDNGFGIINYNPTFGIWDMTNSTVNAGFTINDKSVITEAPIDSKQYTRYDETWSAIGDVNIPLADGIEIKTSSDTSLLGYDSTNVILGNDTLQVGLRSLDDTTDPVVRKGLAGATQDYTILHTQNHTDLEDPHPQYLTPDDLPSTLVSWLTNDINPLNSAFLTSKQDQPESPESVVSATSPTTGVEVLVGQWLREEPFTDGFTWYETTSVFQLDIDSNNNNGFGVLRLFILKADGTEIDLGASDRFQLSGDRETYTRSVQIAGPVILEAGDSPVTRLYVEKNTGGQDPTLDLYMEGSNVTRVVTTIPIPTYPANHAVSHEVGGTDQLNHDNLLNAQGYKSHETIDSEITAIQDTAVFQGDVWDAGTY